MEEKGSLGIYLSRDKATAVWVSLDSDAAVLGALKILPLEGESATIALQAAHAAMRQGFVFDEVFLAVDCGYYTQYNLHSEFDDYAQVESTIKYDAEEAAAADAMNLAATFEITGKDRIGSKVTVYTADRQLLTDILMDVQEGGLDPTFIEPDAVCMGRALCQKEHLEEKADTVFVVLSSASCYLLYPQANYAPTVRTFLIGQGQDVTSVLSREILLLRAGEDSKNGLASLVLIGRTEVVDKEILHQRTGLKVTVETPEKKLAASVDSSGIDCHELLAAYGAALAGRIRGPKADFRRDYMPYQGRRKVLVGSLRTISLSLTILLVAAALFFQLKAFRIQRYVSRMNEKTLLEHKAVTYGKSPLRGMSPTSSLKREFTQAQQMEEGIGPDDEKSVPAKLTFFFDALNKTDKKVDINIVQITITERSMKVKGDTNSRAGTMALFKEINNHPRISLTSERISSVSDGRDAFEITLEPKK